MNPGQVVDLRSGGRNRIEAAGFIEVVCDRFQTMN